MLWIVFALLVGVAIGFFCAALLAAAAREEYDRADVGRCSDLGCPDWDSPDYPHCEECGQGSQHGRN